MATRAWAVPGHIIAVQHAFWTGEARVLVDGIPIIYRAIPPLAADFGFVRRFELDGTRYAVRVMSGWYCVFKLDLFDGAEAERMHDSERAPLWEGFLGVLLAVIGGVTAAAWLLLDHPEAWASLFL